MMFGEASGFPRSLRVEGGRSDMEDEQMDIVVVIGDLDSPPSIFDLPSSAAGRMPYTEKYSIRPQ